jgi:hypothetical protein
MYAPNTRAPVSKPLQSREAGSAAKDGPGPNVNPVSPSNGPGTVFKNGPFPDGH